jgi:hypothetical protein
MRSCHRHCSAAGYPVPRYLLSLSPPDHAFSLETTHKDNPFNELSTTPWRRMCRSTYSWPRHYLEVIHLAERMGIRNKVIRAGVGVREPKSMQTLGGWINTQRYNRITTSSSSSTGSTTLGGFRPHWQLSSRLLIITIYVLRCEVVSLTPDPQPGGPWYFSLSGSYLYWPVWLGRSYQ